MNVDVQLSVREPISGVVYPQQDELKSYLEAGEFTLTTLAQAFKASAQKFPKRRVLAGPEGGMTSAQLDRRSDRLALALKKLGLEQGDRAIFQLPNCNELFVCLLACFKAQVIPVCTLQAHRTAEISYLGKHCDAKIHFVATDDANFDFGVFAKQIRDDISTMDHTIVVRGSVPTNLPNAHDMRMMIKRQSVREARDYVTSQDRDPLQVALFQLSGGSTGMPKVIPRFNYEYAYQLKQVIAFNEYRETDVIMLPTPVMHNANMGCASLPIILAGGTYLVSPAINPRLFFRMLIRYRPTLMGVAGPLLEKFQKLGISKKYRLTLLGVVGAYALGRLRAVVSMNSAAEVERNLHVTGLQLYGMTEGFLTFGKTGDPKPARYETVGRPISKLDKVRIVSPGTEEDLPVGEVGELLVKGPYTIRGFYKSPDLDRVSFTSDGYYRTGDLMRAKVFEGDLYYAFEGRTKDVIDRGGEKINCHEVERAMMSHPDVVAAALVAMPDRKFGERACAMLTLTENALPLTVKTIGAFLETAGLAKYKWPERVEIMEEIPVTNINKPDKVKMRKIIRELLESEGKSGG